MRKMSLKKLFVIPVVLLFTTSLLLSQSLAEAAKKEKERRARLKGKKARVITNDELRKVRKTTAVVVVRTQPPEKKTQTPLTQASSLNKETPQAEIIDEETFFREKKRALEQAWDKTKEYVSLLTTKMNGLWQEYNTMDDMTSRDSIRKEMDETKKKLDKAQKEEGKAKKELDTFLREARKKGIPPGWFR